MIQLCRKDKEKVYQAIRSGNIDAADMALPNLIDDIILSIINMRYLCCFPRLFLINAGITIIFLLRSCCVWLLLQSLKLKPATPMSLLL